MNDVTLNTVSGEIEVIDKDNHSYTLILNSFVGEINLSSAVKRIRFILFGDNEVTSPIQLANFDKQDSISVTGKGFCKFTHLEATVVEVLADIHVSEIRGHIVKATGAKLSSYSYNSWIEVSGHVWLTDSVLETSTAVSAITSDYILVDNCNLDLECNEIFKTDNEISFEHLVVNLDEPTHFVCVGKVLDDNGDPRDFLNVIQSSKDENFIETRRKLYGNTPAKLATPFDKFKQSTGYTHVNLHRHIDQEGQFENPECSPKSYDVGIYALRSHRTTETHYYGDGSLINEIP